MSVIFESKLSVSKDTSKEIIDILNQVLADSLDFYSIVKQAHWNVKGSNFYSVHLLFDTIADGLLPHIDEIGERITALGGLAEGTTRIVAKKTTLSEIPVNMGTSKGALENIANRISTLANIVRKAADDTDNLADGGDTNDLLIAVSRDLDKWTYFVQSHLQA